MNSKQSWLVFLIGAVILIGVFWGFIHGCQIVGDNLQNGVMWIAGSLVVAAISVLLSYKLKK